MKYDFDQTCERKGTGSVKWDSLCTIFGSEDIIPMWIADMDFPAPEPVVEALVRRAKHPCYGYSQPGPDLVNIIVERIRRKLNWEVDPEWIVFTPGIIPALHVAIRSVTRPGNQVIVQEPVYYPFFKVITGSGCQIVNNGLKMIDGRYVMDYEDLESKFVSKSAMIASPGTDVKAMILCSPHNPVCRVWERDELIKAGEIAISHGAVVISDEIHCEILFKGYRHTPFASLSKEFEQNCIVCMAPSKTFNLAGLEVSTVIIPNKTLRNEFTGVRTGILPETNIFGYVALEAAYLHGDEWLEQVLEYLEGNLSFLRSYLKERIKKIKLIEPQGTYLIWLDCRDLRLNDLSLKKLMRKEAKVGMNDGCLFGNGGSGFQRMNIACPRSILAEALRRIESAVNRL
ncbi:MAG TPA: MalY/PatB family protein [Syntrophorhabdaceae bacterium]|nr:MalY/PatB family protein [Syntrophorhabdaceae bacterium]